MEEASKQRGSAASSRLTSLALRLATRLVNESGRDNNLVFSPLSIHAALALVAAGARGAALDELLALLGAASRDDLAELARGLAEHALADTSASGGPLIAFATGIWHDATVVLKPAFREDAIGSYKAEVRAVDFRTKAAEVREEINGWVSEATRELIKGVLSPGSVHPNHDTGLMLVNAVYFKGKWQTPFAERSTEVEKFYLLDGSAVEAPLMRGRGTYLVAVHDGFKVLKLPYQTPTALGGKRMKTALWRGVAKYSMCVFLPDARDGLWSLVDELAASSSPTTTFLHDHLPARKVPVGKLRLPRFKMSFSCEVTGTLREMGLKAMLDPRDGVADLSDMAEEKGSGMPPKIDTIYHKAVIELNEQGTEAAAVTYVGLPLLAAAPPSRPREFVNFVADHPFAFFLVEEVSGAVVFAGCVLDPSQ